MNPWVYASVPTQSQLAFTLLTLASLTPGCNSCGSTPRVTQSTPASTASTTSAGPVSRRSPGATNPEVPRARIGDVSVGALDDVVFRWDDGTWVARAAVLIENISDHAVSAGPRNIRANGMTASGQGSVLFSTLPGAQNLAPQQSAFGEVAFQFPGENPAPSTLELRWTDSAAATDQGTMFATIHVVTTPAPVSAGWVPSVGAEVLPITVIGQGTGWSDPAGSHHRFVRVRLRIQNPTDAMLVVRSQMLVATTGEAEGSLQLMPNQLHYEERLDPGANAEGEVSWWWPETQPPITSVDISYGGRGHRVVVQSGIAVTPGAPTP